MSREIDERIVAMYFDNKNFEKGARETLNTLDELKKSMSMEGLGKGFDAFEQASKKLNFDKLTSGVSKFKSALSTVGSTLSKAFDISVLNNFENKLRSFKNDYFDRLIGFDIAGKLEQSLLNAFRGFAIEPIQMGYKQYESMMDSTKTIMNSTGESLDVVNAKLNQMTEYANQTIYSLTDMTSNLGKFTNNGIALNDATDAMIGLTNATAKAGQGAQQASMAMYNVSQAIGVGKMTSIDWKSLENANVATKELKETFIAAAVANGQLTKKMEKNAKTGQMEAKYFTKAEKGVKSVQVSYENFRETLSSGWLDKDTMMDTFKIFSNQLSVEGIMALGNYTREEAEELYKLGESAMAAAKEVRTFGKMMDALKESTQSGWAKSFEYIFGDVDESTSLWTTINDKIDAMLTAGTEERNNVLMAWRGLMKDENGNVKKIEDVYKQRLQSLSYDRARGNISQEEYDRQRAALEESLGNRELWVDYRDVAVESLTDLIDVVRDVVGQIKAALSDVFGSFDGNGLKMITAAFRAFVDRVKGWLGTADDVNSNLNKIRKAFVVVFTALKLVVAYYKTKVQVILAVARPILEAVLDILARIGEWLTDIVSAKNIGEGLQKIGQKFKDLWKTLSSLGFAGVLDKIGVAFGDFIVSIFASLGGFLDGIGLGGITQFFVDFFDGVKEAWNTVTGKISEWWNSTVATWPLWNTIGTFFTDIWDKITGIFKGQTKRVATEGLNGREWVETRENSPFVQFFVDAWEGIKHFFEEVKGWSIWNDIGKFFSETWSAITGIFKGKTKRVATEGLNGREWVETSENSPFVQFFVDAWEGIKDFFEEVSNWDVWQNIGKFFTDIWDKITGVFKGQTKRVATEGLNGREWVETKENSPFVQFFVDAWEGIKHFFEEVRNWPVWNNIGEFFTDVWNKITGVFRGRTKRVATEGLNGREWVEKSENSPFVQFFVDAWEGIKHFFEAVGEWPVWKNIGAFFTGVWNKITGVFKGKTKRVATEGLNGREWVEKSENSPFVQFFVDAWEGVKNFFDGVVKWPVWKEIGKFFAATWDSIIGIFKGRTERVATTGLNGREWIEVQENSPFVQFFIDAWEGIKNFWNDGTEASVVNWPIWKEIGNFFTNLWDSVTGVFKARTRRVATEGLEGREWIEIQEEAPIVSFFKGVWEGIQDVWGQIVGWEGWAAIGKFFADIWGWIIGLFNGDKGSTGGAEVSDITEESKDTAEKLEQVSSGFADFANSLIGWNELLSGNPELEEALNTAKDSSLLQQIGAFFSDIFRNLGEFVTSVSDVPGLGTIVGLVEKALSSIEGIVTVVLDWVNRLTGTAVDEYGNKINATGWDYIVPLLALVFGLIYKIFDAKSKNSLAVLSQKNIDIDDTGTKMLKIAAAIGIIALSLGVISSIPTDKLIKAGVALAIISGLVIAVVLFMNKLTQSRTALAEAASATADKPVTGIERLAGKLIDALGIAGTIWVLMEELPAVIKVASEAKKYSGFNGDDIFKLLAGIVVSIGGLMISLALVNKLAPKGIDFKSSMKTVLTSFVALATVMGGIGLLGTIIVEIIDEIGYAEIHDANGKLVEAEKLKEELGSLAALYNVMGNMIYEFIRGIFGIKTDAEKIREAADTSDIMAQVANTFDLTRVSGVIRIASMMNTVAETAKGIDTGKLANMSEAMEHLGDALNKFAFIVFGPSGTSSELQQLLDQGDSGIARFTATVGIAREIASLISQLSDISFGENGLQRFINWAYAENGANIPVFIAAINDILTQAKQGLSDGSSINFDGLKIVEKLFDSIDQEFANPSAELKTFDATPIVDAIIAALGLGQTAIANAIHDMVQMGINLVNTSGYEYDTDGLFGGLPDVLSFFDDETLKGLFNPDQLAGIMDDERLQKIFSDFSDKADSVTKDADNKLNKIAEEGGKAWSGATLKIGGVTFDENFLNTIQTQIDEWQAGMEEGGEDFSITIRPVLDFTNFGDETEKLKTFLTGGLPVAVNGNVNIGTPNLNFNSLTIVSELQSIKGEIASVRTDMNSTVENLRVSIGNDLNGLGNDIARLKVYLDRNRLVGWLVEDIDKALYNVGNNAKFTGVPTYVLNP